MGPAQPDLQGLKPAQRTRRGPVSCPLKRPLTPKVLLDWIFTRPAFVLPVLDLAVRTIGVLRSLLEQRQEDNSEGFTKLTTNRDYTRPVQRVNANRTGSIALSPLPCCTSSNLPADLPHSPCLRRLPGFRLRRGSPCPCRARLWAQAALSDRSAGVRRLGRFAQGAVLVCWSKYLP